MINPFKSDNGTLGKIILDQINKLIFLPCKLANRKTQEMIEWFKNIRNKNNASFIVFDIKSFYP